jgi:preprotein translocase subunit SecG
MWYDIGAIAKVVLFILMTLLAIFMIGVVLFQSSNTAGIKSVTGGSDTYFGKNKGKTRENRMKRATIVAAVLLLICAIALLLISTLMAVV